MKKRHKILSIILALVIALGSIVTISIVSSSAESFTDENGIEWTVTENYPGWAIKPTDKETISGEVIIPATYNDKVITAVGGFSKCTNLTSVVLPDGLGFIEASAFSRCTGLTSITIPDSVTTIGNNAFYGCTGLTGELVIPNSVTTIGQSAFDGCTGLTGELVIPNSVTSINQTAFMGCTGLTGELVIPDSITVINTSTFNGCTGLTSVTIPDSVTSIDNSAFHNCKSLTSINLGNNIKTLSGFSDCTGLTSITIPDSVTTIGNSAFDGCTGLTGELVIPDSVTTISKNAFYRCTGITGELVIPNSVTTIGERAFDGCTGLTSVTIPDSVTSINQTAFPRKIYAPPSPNVELFTDENGIEWTVTENYPGWAIKPTDKATISGEVIIPATYNNKAINAICENAFYGCTGLTSITIPDSVTIIGDYAFSDCTKLTGKLVIPNSVTTIDDDAFARCTGLTSITIPNSVTTIGNSAFARCTGLTGELVIPNSVTTIGKQAFIGCTGLTSITIPNSVTTISDSTFRQCTGLTGELVIPNSVTTIGKQAFSDCTGLTSITIPDSVTTIGYGAFRGCKRLASVTIPDSVTIIDAYAFDNCRNAFSSITIGKNIKCVGDYAFANLGELETLTIENEKTSDISITAFYADTFKNLEIADTVLEINTPLLSGNKNFASVGLGSNTTISNPYAFYGNSNMTIETTNNATSVIDYATKNNIPYTIVNNVDVTRNVSFEVTCDKPGYEFTVYRVADLEKGSNPYYIRYDSLITDIEDEIFEGNSEALLTELDKVDSSLLTEVVGTYSTDVDGSSKLFEDLPAGIYYVRATNFPANVYSVQNSVFALPYYTEENGWIYEITPIPLATKVDESNPEIVKTITNSTKDNVNFTDVSLGDTVNFEIKASRVGSANVVESKDFRLNSYVVSDIMENGLTLNQDSFVVTLEDADGNTLTTLEDTTDYVVNVVASEGADTTFTVSLTPEYLQEDEFYSSANVVIAYSAVLNKYSTREFDGNYNTATNLTYSNKTNVSATVEGNTVYAYTFGIEVNKYDDAGTPLAGSQFGLYLTEDDAKAMTNAIATGTSTDTGKVEFYTESNDVIRLASGTYYIVETKATESYNRYTDVIPVTITVNYGDTEINGTYIESAPENGIQLVEVKNSKVVIPNTGGDGAMYRYIIALAFAMLAVALFALKKRSSKKATAIK